MAKDPRDNLRPPFPKGVSGNPSGRPKSLLTAGDVKHRIDKLQLMTKTELEAVTRDPKAKIIDIQIASILLKAVADGDFSRFNGMLDRLIGKVKDQLEVTAVKPYIVEKLDGTQTILGTKVIGENKLFDVMNKDDLDDKE